MEHEIIEREVATSDSSLALINKGEIDMQIATAKKYPRSITGFRKNAMSLVTLNERIAESCIYALPRGGKVIEGASARFAEIVASCYGNCRAGARVVDEGREFVTAQGVFIDLENNVAITYEVQRRITNKAGKRFDTDMIGVTGNAACSIALRNAVFKGVPRAFWDDIYEKAKEVVRGDFATLANRRADIFAKCQGFGVSKEQVFSVLGIAGEADLTLDHIVTLRGLLTAIKDGDTTVEQAFSAQEEAEVDSKPKVKQPKRKTATEKYPAETEKQSSNTEIKTEIKLNAEALRAADEPKGDIPAKHEQQDGDAELLSTSQKKALMAKIEAAGLSTVNIKNQFGRDVDELLKSDWVDVLAFVANPMD